MTTITELTPTKVSDLNKMSRKSTPKARAIRTLMLDLLAKAYEGEDFIHDKYYIRANDVLSLATAKAYDKAIHKAIMRELDLD